MNLFFSKDYLPTWHELYDFMIHDYDNPDKLDINLDLYWKIPNHIVRYVQLANFLNSRLSLPDKDKEISDILGNEYDILQFSLTDIDYRKYTQYVFTPYRDDMQEAFASTFEGELVEVSIDFDYELKMCVYTRDCELKVYERDSDVFKSVIDLLLKDVYDYYKSK